MGYRLYYGNVVELGCGGKLFGYVDNDKLKSYKYLKDMNWLEEDEYFGYGALHPIVLTEEEFKTFMEFYSEDMELHNGVKNWIKQEEVQTAINTKGEKLLEWF